MEELESMHPSLMQDSFLLSWPLLSVLRSSLLCLSKDALQLTYGNYKLTIYTITLLPCSTVMTFAACSGKCCCVPSGCVWHDIMHEEPIFVANVRRASWSS